jgi:hypothetical protein
MSVTLLKSTATSPCTTRAVPPVERPILDENTQRAYDLATGLLREIQDEKISTNQDFFDCRDLYSSALDLDFLYERRGEKFLKLVELQLKLQVTRVAARKANVALGSCLRFPEKSIRIAITQEKVAACGELSILADTLAKAKGLDSKIVHILNREETEGHGLVLLSSQKGLIKELTTKVLLNGSLFLEEVRQLKGVVILDPYLGMVIPAENAHTNTDFAVSLSAMDSFVVNCEGVPEESSFNFNEILREARIVHKYMREQGLLSETGIDLKKDFPVSPLHILYQNFIVRKRCENIHKRLADLFPDTKGSWKYKKPTKEKPSHVMWVEISSEDLAKVMVTKLNEYKLMSSYGKIARKDSYCFQIPVADFGLHIICEKLDSLRPEVKS